LDHSIKENLQQKWVDERMIRRFFFWFGCLAVISVIVTGWSPRPMNVLRTASSAEKTERPHYRIAAHYHDESAQVTGHVTVTLPAKQVSGLREVYFHLYPNAFAHWKWGAHTKPKQPGYLHVSRVKVDGVSVAQQVKETVMKVPLPQQAGTRKTVRIDMDYRLQLPKGGTRLNTFKRTAFLAQWYPMLAVKDQDGWHIEPYTTIGDPFYTRMSDFEITFHVPSGYRLITSARDPEDPVQGVVTLRRHNVRDFAAVITKDYEQVQGKAGSVRVRLWYLPGMEDVAQELHDAAVSGMKFFSQRFGAYPYDEVDVVLGETGYGIAGMEYPGLVTSIPKIPTRQGERPAVNVVVHELAHQWWYGVVGNNQVKEPWLDEGLTTFSEFLFMHDQMGEDERELLIRAAEHCNRINRKTGVTSVESLYRYSDLVYGLMVYTRPAAMMWELADEIGKDKVLRILKTYYQRYQYQIATTEDFIRVANEVAGKDLTPFFDKWLYFKTR
jgi:hypothetical protein